ncbi:retropepsin-like domain-containing protein, partial [Salmonella enterica]|nr:retropepsin-like domain-containing protein [Salmonella enterica]
MQLANSGAVQNVAAINISQNAADSCAYRGEDHTFEFCPSNPASVCFVGNQNAQWNNPHSNTYNPGWRNHPNFAWGSQGSNSNTQQAQQKMNGPLGFGQQNQQANAQYQNTMNQHIPGTSLESLFKEYMAKTDATIQTQQATLRNLEVQMGQIASELKARPHGKLPSDTENSKRERKEQVQAVELRSGRTLVEKKEPTQPKKVGQQVDVQNDSEKSAEKPSEKVAENEEIEEIPRAAPVAPPKSIPTPSPTFKPPPPPFPQRLKQKNQDGQFKKFLEVLKQLHINIPLVEALEQMPNYVKFLKDILTKKRRLGEYETVSLTGECSAILTNKIPPKVKDPGTFTILVSIGGKELGRALCDLGASINLMPLSIYKKLGIGEARPTTVTLQLADRSITYPEGKIEDILVQVDKFIFLADFIILDYEADKDVPIILGRPFLATGRALIDVQKGELTMRVHDQEVKFSVFDAMKCPAEVEECSVINVLDELVAHKWEEELLQHHIQQFGEINVGDLEFLCVQQNLEVVTEAPSFKRAFESLELTDRKIKPMQPSIVEPPKLELKPLP